jgi:heptosyltransferase-2
MNLAVFLPNWVGDAVMATPALRALRRHFSEARITGILRPYVTAVLEGGDLIDDAICTGGLLSAAWQLRRRKIDLAILFPNSFRSALLARLGGCKRRIGYAMHGRSLLLTDAVAAVRDERGRLTPSPIIDAYNLLAESAGCPRPGYRMELWTTPTDEAAADAAWQSTGLWRFREVIALNPGAAFGAAKHWPSEHFAQLAHALARQRGAGILVLCGPTEREQCRQIVAAAGHPSVHGLADSPLSLGLTKACVRRADLLVTTDSGPRHFAAAFGRPVVTLFGPTHIPWTETYYHQGIHLQKKLDCGPCQQRVCPLKHHRCMKELRVEEVLDAVLRLLTGPQRSTA